MSADTDRYEAARRAVEAQLKAARPTRGRIRRILRIDEAIPADQDPDPRAVPAVRIEIRPGGRTAGGTTEGGPVLRSATLAVRCWARGPGWAAMAALWGAVEAALAPADPETRRALDDRLDAAGVWSLRPRRPALPEDQEAMAARVVEAVALLDLQLWDED